jgi:DNA (cytosine-5)-methyltransferase 1
MFARDLQALEGTPYHMDAFEVNAVNYGAPQIRVVRTCASPKCAWP